LKDAIMTKIEWAEETWNPMVGCSLASPGCTNCYAMRAAWRMGHHPKTPQYRGLTRMTKAGPVWTGEVRLVEHKLAEPLRVRKPTGYFVNSMSDLFHETLPDADIDRVFAVMEQASRHIYLILTKRAERMARYTRVRYADRAPPPHIRLGVSVEDQRRADERIPFLLEARAAVRFLSCEPLLGPLNLRPWIGRLDWVIAGAESGKRNRVRPMDLDWVRSLRDQCLAAGVAFFFKQDFDGGKKVPLPMLDGIRWAQYPTALAAPPVENHPP
jgi:protein gp37